MEATLTDVEATPTPQTYSSRPGALIWCFRKSRDRWKSKYQQLKATVKGHTNRVADVTKSRDQWKAKAEDAAARLAAVEAEVAALRAAGAAGAGKKGPPVLRP
jgi:hypothetical protein